MADDTLPKLPQTPQDAFPTDAATQAAFDAAQASPQPILSPQSPAQAPSPAIAASGPVNVFNPEGKLVSIPGEQLNEALNSGYTQASAEEVDTHHKEEKYGTLGQQSLGALEGALSAATFGLSTPAQIALGDKPEDIEGRREANPITNAVGQAAGLVGSAFAGPVGAANILSKAGAGAAKAVGLGAAESLVPRIGSAIVKGAAENALFQVGDETSKIFSSANPQEAINNALPNIGLATLIGGGIGGIGAAAAPLWNQTAGKKLNAVLKGIQEKFGGIDEILPEGTADALDKSGLDLPPEVKARLAGDSDLNAMSKTLEQSDTTAAGKEYQRTYQAARRQADDALVNVLGKSPSEVAGREISSYEAGKKIGNTLSEELENRMSPLSKEFDELKGKFSNTELVPDEIVKTSDYTNPYNPIKTEQKVIPGTTGEAIDKISKLAIDEGWAASPSGEIMREVTRVIKELPNLKTLKDLNNYITQVGNNMQANPLNGALRRAGGMIKGVLKEAEANVAMKRLGEEAPQLVDRFKIARASYADEAKLVDALDDRINLGGGAGSYGKRLKDLARTDGEALARKLSGTNDADLLNLIKEQFPKTAEAIKEYHLDKVIDVAVKKAKAGETFNATAFRGAVEKMSPELRNFVISPEQLGKIQAIGHILDEFNKLPHNFSNTARTAGLLEKWGLPSATGLIAAILSHSPGAGAITALLHNALGKEIPDATRLALLKFLGSNKPANAIGFKAAVDFIQNAAEGKALISKATKNVFKAGAKVLPEAYMPKESDRKKLDKAVQDAKKDPSKVLDLGTHASHYLPEHTAPVGEVVGTAIAYLSGVKPEPVQTNIFDTKIPVSSAKQNAYDRVLDIANQPLVVLDHINKGRLTSSDVVAMKSMYPGLYSQLSEQLAENAIIVSEKGDNVPYKVRQSLSLFMGKPLDSSFNPASIQAAQLQSPPPNSPQTSQEPPQRQKHSMAALNKLPGQFQTPAQARLAEKIKS